MLRTYRYRLYPSRSQEKNLWRVLDACRGLYNMALAERKLAYRLERRKVSKQDFYELARRYRKTFPYANQMFSQTAQSVYKAESAGREIAFVDPACTSKSCSKCGAVFQDFALSTRWITCACGLSLDRDHNAALNILRRAGWDTPVPDNVAPLFASRRGEQGQASVRSPRL